MMLKAGVLIAVTFLISGIANATATNDGLKTVKLKPKVRESTIVKPVTTLSLETLRPFMKSAVILEDQKQFLTAPYVIAQNENRIEGVPGSVLYVRGTQDKEESAYGIYREGQSYKHPITGEKLGFEAINIGTAELNMPGDPAVFKVVAATEGIELGSRLLPSFSASLWNTLTIRPARPLATEGFILSVRDGINQIGCNKVVVISLGRRDGLVEGNTLSIMQSGKKVIDPNIKKWRKTFVQLPDVRIGSLLVFQAYEKLSLGLVLEATEIVNLLDKVKSP